MFGYHDAKWAWVLLDQKDRFSEDKVHKCTIYTGKIFFWISSLRTRQQGLICKKSKEYLNGGHFGIRCINLYKIVQHFCWEHAHKPNFFAIEGNQKLQETSYDKRCQRRIYKRSDRLKTENSRLQGWYYVKDVLRHQTRRGLGEFSKVMQNRDLTVSNSPNPPRV